MISTYIDIGFKIPHSIISSLRGLGKLRSAGCGESLARRAVAGDVFCCRKMGERI
jgi:hypothetical protein